MWWFLGFDSKAVVTRYGPFKVKAECESVRTWYIALMNYHGQFTTPAGERASACWSDTKETK